MSEQFNRIADALERIADNLEIINLPSIERDHQRWFNWWWNRVVAQKDLIKILRKNGELEKLITEENRLKEIMLEEYEDGRSTDESEY